MERALQESTPTKELVRNALRGKASPHCIIRVWRLSLDVILRYGDELAGISCAYPDDIISPHPHGMFIGYQPPARKDPIDSLRVMVESATWMDEWRTEWGHAQGGVD